MTHQESSQKSETKSPIPENQGVVGSSFLGPLCEFNEFRSKILEDVSQESYAQLVEQPLDILLGETLYSEKLRMKRFRANWFTRKRHRADQKLWGAAYSELIKPAAEADRKVLLQRVIHHYADEIGGHFDPQVYKFATHAAPWGMNWLLNAASVQRFLPWGMTQSLNSRLSILGEVSQLQSLSRKGTILLVPTHQSNIDSIVIGYIIYLMSLPPFAYGAGLNLYSNPVLSYFMSRLGAYTVDRNKSNLIYKQTLKNYSTRILRHGVHSIFFPGGGRSRSGAIESRLKLGLLGTALEAQQENLHRGVENSKVFIVPMVMSYHFVLEASSLIENYLADLGKHRFLPMRDESWQIRRVLGFFWKFFSSQSSLTIRVGRPLDVFGNFVDEEGESVGPHGLRLDSTQWLRSLGELTRDPQRDQEYVRELGERLTDRFYQDNTVLTSHLVAFAFFEALRMKYPDYDLFRFLRLSPGQRTLQLADFWPTAEQFYKTLVEKSKAGRFYLSEELLRGNDPRKWVLEGAQQLGVFHDAQVVKISDGVISTDDMSLLYYYRNRLSGYGLSRLAQENVLRSGYGKKDCQGFLE